MYTVNSDPKSTTHRTEYLLKCRRTGWISTNITQYKNAEHDKTIVIWQNVIHAIWNERSPEASSSCEVLVCNSCTLQMLVP